MFEDGTCPDSDEDSDEDEVDGEQEETEAEEEDDSDEEPQSPEAWNANVCLAFEPCLRDLTKLSDIPECTRKDCGKRVKIVSTTRSTAMVLDWVSDRRLKHLL